MSYEKVRSIRITKTEVMINSAMNNIRPLFYETWEAKGLTEILLTKGRKAVEMELLFTYFTGDYQGRSKYANAIAAAEADGAIYNHWKQYKRCCDDPAYREQFLNTLHAYLSGRITSSPSAETKPEHATQQQFFNL